MPLRKSSILLVLAAVLGAAPAASAITYSEGVNGDLSGNRLSPTSLILQPGSNSVSGSTIAGDLDYVTISIPAQLSAIVLTSYTTFLNSVSFMAVQSGTTFTVDASTQDPSTFLGWTHFGDFQEGTNIQDDLAAGVGAQGFTPPLGAGSYTFWIQETGPYDAAYSLDFQVVPEPGSLGLAALGIAALALRRRAAS